MSFKVASVVALVAVIAVLAVSGQKFSREECQKSAQSAGVQIAKAMRGEMKKFQEKLQSLAQGSFNPDQMTQNIDQIADTLQPMIESSTSGNFDMSQLTQMTTQLSQQYIQMGTSMVNTRAPIEAYTAYFNFVYTSGTKISEIMREVQQKCVQSS